MGLKKLNQFIRFDWNRFAADKELKCVGVCELLDYETKEHLGTKVEAVIAKDNTKYKLKAGEEVSNIYEKLTFKVMKDVKPPINSSIEPVNVEAKAYGENGFVTKLSITCDDIRVIQVQKGV